MPTLGVYIGRFQPLHNGHVETIEKGLEMYDKLLIIIGSINQNNTCNPFSYQERSQMIFDTIPHENLIIKGLADRDELEPKKDISIDRIWYIHLNNLINDTIRELSLGGGSSCSNSSCSNSDTKVILLGATKDDSTSEYMKLIKESTRVSDHYMPIIKYNDNEHSNKILHATDIRIMIRDYHCSTELNKSIILKKIQACVPDAVIKIINKI